MVWVSPSSSFKQTANLDRFSFYMSISSGKRDVCGPADLLAAGRPDWGYVGQVSFPLSALPPEGARPENARNLA
jgi:hypothetical protein